ncbi:hypothetical protein I4U23_021905 [Adineta vaga]|nr:hypothetical protein I4U23_021905 [Adineta vaga]
MNHIDHLIINTRDRLDQIAAYFKRMGFIITPRGYHSSGTINHTIVFKTDYLELFGYTPDIPLGKRLRLEKLPIGLVNMVIKADDIEQVQTTLIARDSTTISPLSLSRPVSFDKNTTANAAFCVTRLEPAPIPGVGITYYHHFNPELVWRPEWQTHPNGCIAMLQLHINVTDPHAAVQIFRRAMDIDKFVNTESNCGILYLPTFKILLTVENNEPLGMYKLTFAIDSIDKLVAALEQSDIEYHKKDGCIVTDTEPHIGCVLEFEPMP